MDAAERSAWQEADRQLALLLELDEGARRQALDELRLGADVRAHLERLLASATRGHALIDAIEAATAARDAPLTGNEGRIVGEWRLQRLLGRGGMASVWRATRVGRDYSQHAAIKLLGHDVVSDGAAELRFRRERQILARLDHPHIAHLIDGGVADDGTPYLVMALVEGTRIDAWCDANRLDPRARARLLLQVCDAVAHAHRQLVVHRDIKPGNILVDASGNAVLLDFGIARITLDERGERTITRAFTPEYAAPEQCLGSADLGTPVDVYGLGAVLFRLLAGTPPTRGPNGEVERASRVVAAAGDAAAARLLRGDLDAILARALRQDPEHRYGSVDAFAADLRLWLEQRPVAARPRNPWRRLALVVRRNPLPTLLAAACVALTLTGATLLVRNQILLKRHAAELESAVGFQSAMLERLAAGKLGAILRRRIGATLASQDVAPALQQGVLARTDFTGIAADLLDEALLAEAADAARTAFATRPLLEAAVLEDIAAIYRRLFRLEAAAGLRDEAVDLYRATLGEGDRRTLAGVRGQVRLRQDLNHQGVLELAEHNLALHRARLGAADPDTARAAIDLGGVLLVSGSELERAEELITTGIATLARHGMADGETVAIGHANLGQIMASQERHAEAAAHYALARDHFVRHAGPDDVSALELGMLIAYVHGRTDGPQRAHDEYAALYPRFVEVLGEYDPRTLNVLNNVAALPRRQGNFAAALPMQRKAYEGMRLALGAENQVTVRMQINLAEIELGLGHHERARELLEDALAQPRLGDSIYDVPRMQNLLARVAEAAGDLAAAIRWSNAAWQSAADPAQPGLAREAAARLARLYPAGSDDARLWLARGSAGTPPSAPVD